MEQQKFDRKRRTSAYRYMQIEFVSGTIWFYSVFRRFHLFVSNFYQPIQPGWDLIRYVRCYSIGMSWRMNFVEAASSVSWVYVLPVFPRFFTCSLSSFVPSFSPSPPFFFFFFFWTESLACKALNIYAIVTSVWSVRNWCSVVCNFEWKNMACSDGCYGQLNRVASRNGCVWNKRIIVCMKWIDV